jgi:hypothetical protein
MDNVIGKKVRINHLYDESDWYDGKEGVVEYIDDIGQWHGTWGGIAIIPDADDYDILD